MVSLSQTMPAVPDLKPYELLNLGNHRSERLSKIIALLEQELGVAAQQELLPMQPGDVPATCADIRLAQARLVFKPATAIEEGIARFIQWFREYHRTP